MNHKGYLRHLVVRKGIHTNEIMVNIVTSSQEDFDMYEFKDMLLGIDLKSELVGVLHTINDGLADAVQCDELRVLYGRDYIQEEILGLKFKISPFSFSKPILRELRFFIVLLGILLEITMIKLYLTCIVVLGLLDRLWLVLLRKCMVLR